MTPEMIAILAVGASLASVIVALGGLIWQSHRALRADLSTGLREAKEDRERLRADLSGRMDRIEGRMRDQGTHLVGIEGVLRDQGERIARIEGMLHLHLGRNADIPAPTAAAE